MRIVHLTGERVYLRPIVLADKERVSAWHPGPFPLSAVRAESILKAEGEDASRRLVLVRREDDEVVGSVMVSSGDGFRRCVAEFHMSPSIGAAEADALRAEALRLILTWLRDEVEVMAATVDLAEDQSATIAAAEELGMVVAVRLREFFARPGGRVNKLVYQALNRGWEVRDA
jgi:RimJ/RimL family protein N-acetyltransferase